MFVAIPGMAFSIGLLFFCSGVDALAYQRFQPENVLETVIITEAGGEPYEGKVGVAEVMRNRGWGLEGFAGIRRSDLHQFLSRQPAWAYDQARQALQEARAGSNLTRRATHFENVQTFGPPAWAREMEVTVKIGQLTFFKKRHGVNASKLENEMARLRAA